MIRMASIIMLNMIRVLEQSKNHEKVITANDPNARSTFWNIDKDGNKIGGRSVCGSGK